MHNYHERVQTLGKEFIAKRDSIRNAATDEEKQKLKEESDLFWQAIQLALYKMPRSARRKDRMN